MRLRWGLSERIPGGPTYRAPYGANKIETINITFYLLILDLEIGFTLCSICFLGWDKRNQQNMAARGLPKKLQTWYGFLYDNDDDDDDIDD